MRMPLVFSVVLLFLASLPQFAVGQKSLLKIADQYFEAGKYQDAAKIYTELDKKVRKDTRLLIRRGIAHYHANNPAACIKDMEAARKLKTRDKTIYKYAGLAAFDKGEYTLSAEYLKFYLRFLKPGLKEFEETVRVIKRCGKAQKLKFESSMAFVQNMGTEINTPYKDFSPVQSPTRQDRIYFSSCRKDSQGWMRDINGLENPITGTFTADIYYSDSESGIWIQARPLENLIHSPKHEWIQGFSSDGSILYYIQSSDLKKGLLLTDTFGTEKQYFQFTANIDLPFDATSGDRDLQIFSDSFIVFSSNRIEGYGGYDIYYATKSGGVWNRPVNFGETINSEFDEISPFITKNGKVLYFSSDRIEGAGAMDIYKAAYDPELKKWDTPANMALPVNSTKDDIGWKISSDGTTAYFYSNRIGGFGDSDIYIAFLNDQEINQLEYTEIPDFSSDQSSEITIAINENFNSDRNTRFENNPNIPLREYISTPLYYKINEDIFTPQNLILLKRIAELMQIFPELKLKLSAHSTKGTRRDVDLFMCVKNAEKIAEFLKSKQIREERIYITAYGSDMPYAKNFINGIPSNLGIRYNNRIDIEFFDVPEKKLKIISDFPTITENYKSESWDVFKDMDSGISFSLKLIETPQMYNGDAFNLETPLKIHKNFKHNFYIYSIGIFKTVQEALDVRQMLIKQNICLHCPVISFFNGKLLSDDDIKKLSENNPDLLMLR